MLDAGRRHEIPGYNTSGTFITQQWTQFPSADLREMLGMAVGVMGYMIAQEPWTYGSYFFYDAK